MIMPSEQKHVTCHGSNSFSNAAGDVTWTVLF